jgi:hypothetical protein
LMVLYDSTEHEWNCENERLRKWEEIEDKEKIINRERREFTRKKIRLNLFS